MVSSSVFRPTRQRLIKRRHLRRSLNNLVLTFGSQHQQAILNDHSAITRISVGLIKGWEWEDPQEWQAGGCEDDRGGGS